jgi:hypothetical protein
MHDEDRLKEKLAKPGTPHMVRRHAAELCESRPSPTPARSGSSLRRPKSSPGRWETGSPSTRYTRFAGSVFEEYLYRSPKRAAEMINERMALAAERVFGAADCGNPDPGVL